MDAKREAGMWTRCEKALTVLHRHADVALGAHVVGLVVAASGKECGRRGERAEGGRAYVEDGVEFELQIDALEVVCETRSDRKERERERTGFR